MNRFVLPLFLVSITAACDQAADISENDTASNGKNDVADSGSDETTTTGGYGGGEDTGGESTSTGSDSGGVSTSTGSETGGEATSTGSETGGETGVDAETLDLIVHGVGLPGFANEVVHGRIGNPLGDNGPISSATVDQDDTVTLTFPGQFPANNFGVFLLTLVEDDDDGECNGNDLVRRSFISNTALGDADLDAVEATIDFSEFTANDRLWCEDWDGFVPSQLNLECGNICDNRADGSCFTDCVTFCGTRVRGQSEALQQAFAECVESNPMCFMSVEQCVQGRLDQL